MDNNGLDKLRLHLDGRWAEVREMARSIYDQPGFAFISGETPAEQRAHTRERVRQLVATGATGIGFPKQHGGGDDPGGGVTAFEMLALGDLSLLVKMGVQFGLFGGAILHLGTTRHHDAYLRDLIAFELPGCFAMTETGHGSNVAALRTTATYDPDAGEWIINTPIEAARKDYIGNAAEDGRAAVVFAQLITAGETHGVHAFVVPIRDSSGRPALGVRIEDCGHKAGLNGVDNGRLWFDHVRVPRENLLNRYADVAPDGTYSTSIDNPNKRFFTMLGTLIQGRIAVSGGALSATKVALAIAVRYAEVRRQFAAPGSDDEVVLLDYLAHQRRLLPALARTYAMHFAQAELVEALNDGFTGPDSPEKDVLRRELEAQAAGVKAISTWHATATIQTCREACGGAGYLDENRLPGLKADTDVFTTFEGDNTVLLQLVAKELLTGYRDHFGELDWIGTTRFVADQAWETLVERTAVRKVVQRLRDAALRRQGEADMLDRSWHLEMLEWREKHLLDALARRLRPAADADDPFAVFQRVQDHMLTTARAHVDRLLLESFLAGIDACPDEQLAKLLDTVCDLFVLSVIEQDRGWFQEHGKLTAQRSKAVLAAVNDLCAELRPQARLLIDAFGIPESCIAAPIALGAEAKRQEEMAAS